LDLAFSGKKADNLFIAMDQRKPTIGAQKRFEALDGMMPATVCLSLVDEGCSQPTIKGSMVDVSAGGMCLRVPLTESDAEVLKARAEGDFVEVAIDESPRRRWTVLGHLAWIWVPSMVEDDIVGSLGVTISGVIEEDERLVGKLRGMFGRDREVQVDRAARPIEIPSKSRKKATPEGNAQ